MPATKHGGPVSSFQNRLGGNALLALARTTQHTTHYHITGQEHAQASHSAGKPILWSSWHGMTMMLAGYFLRDFDPSQLVLIMPADWRGETLEHWVKKMGAIPFRLQLKGDATMGSARKLVKLVRLVKAGKDCYMTPDGPEGPAYVIKPGVAYIAQKTGATVLPIGAYTRTGYRVNRWDTYVVPYPFSRIAIVIGEPIATPKTKDYAEITEPLTDAIHRATAQARANYYEIASWKD